MDRIKRFLIIGLLVFFPLHTLSATPIPIAITRTKAIISPLTLTSIGQLTSQKFTTVQSTTPGEVKNLYAQTGDWVKKNKVLAKVKSPRGATINIKAPFAGQIQDKKVHVGSVVAAGTPLFQLINTYNLQAILPLPQNQRDNLKRGLSVTLVSPTTPKKTVNARISRIRPAISPATRTFDVMVKFRKPQGWFAGSSVTGIITLKKNRTVTLVPQTSIVTLNNQPSVFVINNNIAHQHKVTVGNTRKNGWVEILRGLKSGVVVATDGAAYLHHKAHVTIKSTHEHH